MNLKKLCTVNVHLMQDMSQITSSCTFYLLLMLYKFLLLFTATQENLKHFGCGNYANTFWFFTKMLRVFGLFLFLREKSHATCVALTCQYVSKVILIRLCHIKLWRQLRQKNLLQFTQYHGQGTVAPPHDCIRWQF